MDRRTSAASARALAVLLAGILLVPSVASAGKKTDTYGKSRKPGREASAPTDEVAPGLRRAPYLQSLGRDSVLVVWDSPLAGQPVVDYGTTAAFGDSAVATSDGSRRVAVLRGLAPGSTCFYRVRAGARMLAEGPAYSFRTDAGTKDRTFSFFATGDIGDAEGEQAATAVSILRAEPRPEFGLVTGDVVYPEGRSSDYDHNLMRPWKDLLCALPVWPALGNHDWKTDPETNFRREWYLPGNEHWYSFDFGNAHFVALDTFDETIYDKEAQLRWLEADLISHAGAEWTFVYYHHPGLTCTYKGNARPVLESLMPILDRHQVDVVLNGHAHTYERLYPIRAGRPVDVEQDPNYVDPKGTIYIVTGAGSKLKEGQPTRMCGPTAFFKDQTVLWTQVLVDGPRCTIRSVTSVGDKPVDTITITKTRLASGSGARQP